MYIESTVPETVKNVLKCKLKRGTNVFKPNFLFKNAPLEVATSNNIM